MLCTDNYFDIAHYLKALLGVNNGLTSLRLMQVDTDGNYFDCDRDLTIDTPEALFRLLLDTDACGHPCIRVDIVTDDTLCASQQTCNNAESDWFADFGGAIAKGLDGAPVLRIMLSSYS
jgi:hypothetical protein